MWRRPCPAPSFYKRFNHNSVSTHVALVLSLHLLQSTQTPTCAAQSPSRIDQQRSKAADIDKNFQSATRWPLQVLIDLSLTICSHRLLLAHPTKPNPRLDQGDAQPPAIIALSPSCYQKNPTTHSHTPLKVFLEEIRCRYL